MQICFIQEALLSEELHGKEEEVGSQGLMKTYRVFCGRLSPTGCVGEFSFVLGLSVIVYGAEFTCFCLGKLLSSFWFFGATGFCGWLGAISLEHSLVLLWSLFRQNRGWLLIATSSSVAVHLVIKTVIKFECWLG